MSVRKAGYISYLKFSSSHIKYWERKSGVTNFNNIFYLTKFQLLFQYVSKIKNVLMKSLSFFFVLSLQNQICIVHLEIILIQTSHISRAQEPHMTIGYYIGSIVTWSSYSANTYKFLSQISS